MGSRPYMSVKNAKYEPYREAWSLLRRGKAPLKYEGEIQAVAEGWWARLGRMMWNG